MYHYITQDKRTALAALLRAGLSQRDAAKELGINQPSISRELERNTGKEDEYHSTTATVIAREWSRESKAAFRKIEHDSELASRIESRLHPLVSPEVIAHDENIVHETIYAWICRSRPDLKAMLPERGKKRRGYGSKREKKQGWTQDVRSIRERSPGVEHQSRTRHFEGDTVSGPKSSLLTFTDRKSRFEEAIIISYEGCGLSQRIRFQYHYSERR